MPTWLNWLTSPWTIIFFGCFVAAYGNAMNKLVATRQNNLWAWEKKSEGYKAEHPSPTLKSKAYKRNGRIVFALGIFIILAVAVPMSLGYTPTDLIAMV